SKRMVVYFEALTAYTSNYKAAANWLMGPVKSFLNEQGMGMSGFQVPPVKLAELINMIDAGKLNYSVAAQSVFPAMLESPQTGPEAITEKLGLKIEGDQAQLKELIAEVIIRFPDKVQQYRS